MLPRGAERPKRDFSCFRVAQKDQKEDFRCYSAARKDLNKLVNCCRVYSLS